MSYIIELDKEERVHHFCKMGLYYKEKYDKKVEDHDAIILCQYEKEIDVHACIMESNEIPVYCRKNGKEVYNASQFPVNTMEKIIRFLYTGKTVLVYDEAVAILTISKLWKLTDLENLVKDKFVLFSNDERYLFKCLNDAAGNSNLFDNWMVVLLLQKISLKFFKLINQPEFWKLNYLSIYSILYFENLPIDVHSRYRIILYYSTLNGIENKRIENLIEAVKIIGKKIARVDKIHLLLEISRVNESIKEIFEHIETIGTDPSKMSEIKKIQFDMALEKVLSKEKRSDRSDNLESIEHSKRPEQICKKYYLPVAEYATNFAPQTMTPPRAITNELTLLTSRRKPKPQIIESNNDAENLQGSRVISQTVSSVEQNSHVTESVINDPENTTQNNPFKQLEMSKDLLMSTQKRQIVTSTPKAAKTPSIVETSKESSDISNLSDQFHSIGTKASEQSIPTIHAAGLKNLGNTCFINSCLQIFFNIEEFSQYFEEVNFITTFSNKLCSKLLTTFASIYNEYKSGKYSVISPFEFYLALKKSDGTCFAHGQQHDVMEFENFLFKTIEDEYKQKTDMKPLSELFNFKIFNELACYQCKRNSSTGETERILILNLPDLKKTDVEQLIKNYFSTEIIDNWNCVKCSKNTSVHKRSKLVQSPQILIIHLNRFQKKNDYFQKNDIEIEFANHTIDLTNYGNTSENPKYELFGVIAHEGSMTQGHYMNYIKFNNLWFKFDDEKVSKVDENAVMSGAYVLYLRRLGTKTNKQ